MNNDVEAEILFNIESEFEDREIDSKQLLNQVIETADGYRLRVYGSVLEFNEDGDLL